MKNKKIKKIKKNIKKKEIISIDENSPAILGKTNSKELVRTTKKSSKSSKDIISYDPLTAYLREIQNYKRLTKEEEIELAKRYKNNDDLKAAYELLSRNLWLVVKISRDYEKAARSLLDVIQEGNMGLMEAVKKFDPYKDVRFPTYAVWWIKAYIIKYVMANWRMVKIGTTQAQRKLFFNLKKEKEKLEREGFFPAPKLLAEKLDVREKDVIEMEQRLGSPDMSMDLPSSEDSNVTIGSNFASSDISAEQAVIIKENKSLIKNSIDDFRKTLNDKETLILDKRLLSEDISTLQELSTILGVSKERVRQIEKKIKEKLKNFLPENFNDEIE